MPSIMKQIFAGILLLSVYLVVSPDIAVSVLTVPSSSVVKIGDRVELKCSAFRNVSVIWLFTPLNSSSDTNVYLADNIIASMRLRYKIDNNISGQHNLIIDSVDLAHAGRYRCTALNSPTKSSAQLTVLDSSPKCSSNRSSDDTGITEHGYLWMWCRISYTGNMIPVFNWTKDNAKNVTVASDTSREQLTTASSVLTQVHSDDNGATFKCRITFQLLNNTETNPPDYEYTWNYTTNVTYAPRNLTVTHQDMSWLMKSVYDFGDRLVCSTDGNPPPTYEWMEIETNRTSHGSILTIDDQVTSEKDHSFRCTAYNTVVGFRRQIAEMVTFTVRGRVTPTPCEAPVIALTAAGVIAIIGLVALGLGVALTVKACTKSNSVNRKSSIPHQDREMVAESNIHLRDGENLPLSKSTPHKEDETEDHSAEVIACEGYASLKRGSSATFVQPPVYAQLQLYANISSSE